jgi:hypothetical protein
MSDEERFPVHLTRSQIEALYGCVSRQVKDYVESLRIAERYHGGRWGFTDEHIQTLRERLACYRELYWTVVQHYPGTGDESPSHPPPTGDAGDAAEEGKG